uniref:Uncharacterized protein n=1 Tax=Strongyloides venezuelensis TaxID=75913 RepID=A0A0K0EVM3_STRVS
MKTYTFINILIFLIIPNCLVNCLVLYHRVPKPRLICHEEVLDNTTHGGVYRSKNHNKQIPIIPEEESNSGMHIEHIRHRRQRGIEESEEEGPILEVDGNNKILLNNFEIISKTLNNSQKEEIRKKIVNMCQAFNIKN